MKSLYYTAKLGHGKCIHYAMGDRAICGAGAQSKRYVKAPIIRVNRFDNEVTCLRCLAKINSMR